MTTIYPTPRQVGTLALELSEAAVDCRDKGHSWRTSDTQPVKGGGYTRTLRCTRNCGVYRDQVLDRTGYIVSNRYRYPPVGYRFSVPVGPITVDYKAAIRLAAVLREVEAQHGKSSGNNLRPARRRRASTS